MKWLKKWSYLILLIGGGLVYLTCVDRWQVYAQPLAQAKDWCVENDVLMIVSRLLLGEMGESPKTSGEDGQGNLSEGEILIGMLGEEAEDGQQSGAPGDTAGNQQTEIEDASPELGAEGQWGSRDESAEKEADSQLQNQNGTAAGNTGNHQDRLPEKPGDRTPLDKTGDSDWNEVIFGEGTEPVYMTVEDDYFADAVFIGDSRTVGMFEYGGLEEITTFYASTGMSVYKFYESEFVEVPGQKDKLTVEEALQEKRFAKVYLMLGINEMGTGNTETFIQKYSEVVSRIRELQPDAVIYLQAIMKVSAWRDSKGDYINNEGIIERNEAIEELADNEKVFFLDVNPLICDESGAMNADYTFDGVHLKAKYIEIWKQFLKEHAVVQ